MPQVCTVCSHEDAVLINEELVLTKRSNRTIARQYSLHHDAVRRHRQHIPQLLLEASRETDLFEVDSILMQIENLQRETLEQLEALKDADEDGFVDRRAVLLTIREQRANIELVARVRQLIDTAPQVNMVLIAPEVRNTLIEALEPHPEARDSVVSALRGIEAAS
jgi:hypothetical protein